MPTIIPLRDLKNASEVSKLVHDSDTPVFVTKNGEADLVIMTSQMYDRLFVEKFINGSSSQGNAGNGSPAGGNFPVSIYGMKQLLEPICEKNNIEKLVLYGSYIEGVPGEDNEIELAIRSDLKGVQANRFLKEITEALHCSVGLVELSEIPSGTEMDKTIRKTGVILYERQEKTTRPEHVKTKKKNSEEDEDTESEE